MSMFLDRDDFEEPVCLLDMDKNSNVTPVPQKRIMEKLDEYMSRRDYPGVERHLKYWLEEARHGNDLRGKLTIRNELIGHYRKVSDRDKAYLHGDEAIKLLEKLNLQNSISGGTTYINLGTAANSFGDNEKALELFEKAKDIYESTDNVSPSLLGGLYNNMGLTLNDLKRFDEALEMYGKAINIMDSIPEGSLEAAVSYLNMANTLEEKLGIENAETKIFSFLDKAYDLLLSDRAPRDGYYAYVCEKCAPTFQYYGYFAAYQELKKLAEEIYERP